MEWFRSWHGAPTDNKWLVIARRANTLPGIVAAIFWTLEDYASQNADRGSVAGFDIETYAVYSGFDEGVIAAVISALKDKEVISQDDRLTNWEKRQPKREDDSAERVRNWRAERRSNVTETLPVEPEQDVTQCNAGKRSVTHGNTRTDTDTDTDNVSSVVTKKDTATPPAPAKAKAEPKEPREPNETYQLAQALADVCKMDFEVNKPRLLKEAQTLRRAKPPPTPDLLKEHYNGRGGWWWSHDWRGRRGDTPQPATVRETWGKWAREAAPQELPVETYR